MDSDPGTDGDGRMNAVRRRRRKRRDPIQEFIEAQEHQYDPGYRASHIDPPARPMSTRCKWSQRGILLSLLLFIALLPLADRAPELTDFLVAVCAVLTLCWLVVSLGCMSSHANRRG